MTHRLIRLMDGTPMDSLAIRDLNQMTKDGIDVLLIADIMARAHSVIRRLGLDPADTTALEIYNALLSSVASSQAQSLLNDTDYVLLDIDGSVISFNKIDVVNNYHHQLPLEKRQLSFAKRGLGWEITKRYKNNKNTDDRRVVSVIEKQTDWPTSEPKYCRIDDNKASILVVGDVVTEALITPEGAHVEITGQKDRQKISLDLGARINCHSELIEDATGGAANAAVAFSKLDLQVNLMAWLGGDSAASQTINYLRKQGIDLGNISQNKNARSHFHYVLRHGLERTILAHYEPFDYVWRKPKCIPEWLYLSMISDDSDQLQEDMLGYLEEHSQIKFAFQPGPSHIKSGHNLVKKLIKRSDVVVMNMDEAMSVTGRSVRNAEVLLKQFLSLGAKQAVITDSVLGSYGTDGKSIFIAPKFPDQLEPVDRTGAGDAYASTLVAELARSNDLEKAMTVAAINSMSVVTKLGAQSGLLSAEQIKSYLNKDALDYKIDQRKI